MEFHIVYFNENMTVFRKKEKEKEREILIKLLYNITM